MVSFLPFFVIFPPLCRMAALRRSSKEWSNKIKKDSILPLSQGLLKISMLMIKESFAFPSRNLTSFFVKSLH